MTGNGEMPSFLRKCSLDLSIVLTVALDFMNKEYWVGTHLLISPIKSYKERIMWHMYKLPGPGFVSRYLSLMTIYLQ